VQDGKEEKRKGESWKYFVLKKKEEGNRERETDWVERETTET